MTLVRTYLSDLEEFGKVEFGSQNSAFQTQNGDATVSRSNRDRPTEYAVLNEPQATLLVTWMRNSPIVVEFKLRLVKAFFDMRAQL